MLTVDTAVLGRRGARRAAGFSLPPKIGLGTLVDGACTRLDLAVPAVGPDPVRERGEGSAGRSVMAARR